VSMSIDLFLKKEEELGRQCSPSPCDSLSSRSRQ
jgi:hypothetical protein